MSSNVEKVEGPKREIGDQGKIWWSNGIFFTVHVFALYGATCLSPLSQTPLPTLILCFISWQLASFGITIGYHRLWSHQAFTARMPLRVVLAWMGSMGFQGSIKWWVLRHRLYHRFTDSPTHDPYSASKGLWYSHCGWIFRKPRYARMRLIDRADLDADPGMHLQTWMWHEADAAVVYFQHKYYFSIALFSGLILPALIGYTWNDALGGLVWGGAVARLLIWHTTFCINSLAHWTGLRPYTEEVSARGNYLLALLTSGEGHHNFHHAFPKDFRNGPNPADWDPSKWIIYLLHLTPLVPSVARTPSSSILKAQASILRAEADRLTSSIPAEQRAKSLADLPRWSKEEAMARHGQWVVDYVGEEEWRRRRMVLLLIEGCLVDVGGYLDEHPGGKQLLINHCIAPLATGLLFTAPLDPGAEHEGESAPACSTGLNNPHSEIALRDASKAFFGGLNNHSAAAKDRMRCLRVAVLEESDVRLEPKPQ